MARKGQKFQQYTSELKAEAVRLYEEEGQSGEKDDQRRSLQVLRENWLI
ncbi:hypothetical protein ADA01nite_42590 [Aneurinibacillus danicus]|jgi:transposase-like protein|uniref:Uncharacterized protein n=1 Tax=Aneurinibacillus danicus TaxID=267746 RepID=A0A511VDA1_9BACL|nr:hypothetical protein ADA01nite_42590 [Aneurinibacillus danicus]